MGIEWTRALLATLGVAASAFVRLVAATDGPSALPSWLDQGAAVAGLLMAGWLVFAVVTGRLVPRKTVEEVAELAATRTVVRMKADGWQPPPR